MDFKEASLAFRRARQDNTRAYQDAVEKGTIATERQRAGQTGFGAKLRPLRKRAISAVASHAASSTVTPAALEFVEAKTEEGLERTELVWNPDVAAMLAQVRSKERADQKRKRDQLRQDTKLLEDFVEGGGQPLVQEMLETIPELDFSRHSLRPMPSEKYTSVYVVPDHSLATKCVASFASSHVHSSNLAKVLQDDWKQKNRVIHETVEMRPREDPVVLGKCLAEGRCVCQGRGLQLKQFKNAVLRHFKACFPKVLGSARQHLLDGMMVLSLHSEAKPHRPPSGWDLVLAELEASEDDQEDESQAGKRYWFHIASHYLRPYKPVLQELQLVSETDDEVLLEQSGDFCELIEAIEKLDLSLHWHLGFHKMVTRATPLLHFLRRQCLVPSLDPQCKRIWPQARRSRGQGGVAPRQADTEHFEPSTGSPELAQETPGSRAEPPPPTAATGPSSTEPAEDLDVSSEDDSSEDNPHAEGSTHCWLGWRRWWSPCLTNLSLHPKQPRQRKQSS